jgi:hypothetical protein
MEEVSVQVSLKKTTKTTHVYENSDKGLTGMYFPKTLFGAAAENPPKTLTLTLK